MYAESFCFVLEHLSLLNVRKIVHILVPLLTETKRLGQKFPLREVAAQLGPAPANARSDCSERATHNLGDLLIAQSLNIAEDDCQPLLRRETGQTILDLFTYFATKRVVLGGFTGSWCPGLERK